MADDWSAFSASTAPPAASAPPSAPDDGWAAFSAAPAPAASFQSVAPRYLQPSEPGYSPSAMTNLSPEDWAKFNAGVHPGAAPAPSPPPKTGYLANLAAGGNAAVAGTLGLPVDIASGGINLATRGINAVAGTDIQPIVDPVGGSGTFKRAMGVVGANPDEVRPDSVGQEIARGVGGGLVSAAIPAGAVAGLVRGGVMAAPTAARVLSVAGDLTPQNALLGAASGGTGEAAASQVPDQYKPVAGLAGGLAGVGIPAGLVAGGRGIARAVGDYVAPAMGRVNPLLDATRDVITDASGAPINMLTGEPLAATPNQVQLAAQRLQGMASDPAAVRDALANQGPPAIADQPTTAQLTRDPGLLAAERGISRTVPQAQAPYLARASAQNDTRVGVVRGVAEGGDPAALPTALQQQTADGVAAASARVAQIQNQAAGDVAQTEATGQARIGGLQQTAGQARTAMGGDFPAGSEGQVGAAVRAPMKAFDDAARARESTAWNSIDPEGKLAVDMGPIKAGAAAIIKDRSPLAEPMAGKEAGIFDTVAGLQNVHSFKDLSALRGRLTDAIRQERSNPAGDAQAVRRMSILLGHVHDAMEGSLVADSARDARAVASGTLAPDQTAVAKFVSARDMWHDEQANAANSTPVSVDPGSSGRDAAGRSSEIPPVGRAADAGGSGTGNRDGAGGVSPGPTAEVAPLKGSNAKPPTLHDFMISLGGVKDESGEFAAQDLGKIHHRGGGRLINPNGLSHDYAREAAVTEGFLPEHASVNDFRDAMQSDKPVYRIAETEEARQRLRDSTEAHQESEARYNSRDAVATAADEAGIRLSRVELDHATDLHMRGAHADEALQQAAAAHEGGVLDRNAAANAFGSPGIPLAAQQSNNGLNGATRLAANFDQAAADRYAAARQLTAERKGGFDGAPGVKSILQGGSAAGTFKLPDASVAASVIRVGAAGADHVRAYLAKGGSPEALADAAAFSLRRDAMRPDGTLDPAKYATWAQQRSSFLSALPDASARFGAAADAQRAVEAGSADAAQSLKDAVKAAQHTVDEAVAARADQAKAVQRSVVGKFLGDADPVTRVASILRSPTAVADMRTLAGKVANDPEAKAGLQRAVAEHILRDLKGNTAGAGGTENFLKGDQLQTFLRTREPALREVLTPAQMTSLRSVAESLERSNLSVSGSKLAGGSDSLQIASAGAGAAPSTFLGNFMHQAATHAGTAAGGALGFVLGGGPVGALAGAAIGKVGDWGVQAARAASQAGMRTVDDLVANAMLHPQLAAVLMAKQTPANRESLGRALVSQLRRISLVSTAVGQQGQSGPPSNTLLH